MGGLFGSGNQATVDVAGQEAKAKQLAEQRTATANEKRDRNSRTQRQLSSLTAAATSVGTSLGKRNTLGG